MELIKMDEPICKTCGQPVKAGEQCYETRFGSMEITTYQEFLSGNPIDELEFEPDSSVEYWHAKCPVPSCDHKDDPIIPTELEVQNSPVWKLSVNPEIDNYIRNGLTRFKFHWKKTDTLELQLRVEYWNDDGEEDDQIYIFTKCPKCGVIQNV